MARLETRSSCRCCGSTSLELLIDFGQRPLADGLLASAAQARQAPRYPLRLAQCADCRLLQLLDVPDPETLFGRDFPYYSSVSSDLVAHAAGMVADIIRRQPLASSSLVVEIASNDGYLLRHFQARGIPTLGIDPASGPVAAARARGVETLEQFFDQNLAEELAAAGRQADVIVANNVLAHVPDPVGFLRGVGKLLKPGGLVVMEVAWGRSLLSRRAFDTIYHEHHCYFTATALLALFEQAGLGVEAIDPVEVHLGSLRIRARHQASPNAATRALIDQEQAEGLFETRRWLEMADSLDGLKQSLRDFLAGEQAKGLRLAGYGAAAKGTMLLNWCELDDSLLAWVADANPHKQGLFIPGSGLEVVPPARIQDERPDRILLLPWNWAEEIARQQADWLALGGRFILPLPEPHYL